MAQAAPTTCAHNAPGQVLVAGRPVSCRQCGAQIEPSPRAVNSVGQLVSAAHGALNATYPEDASPASAAWAFAQ
jgi:hypothetical protein